jgi:hypothetical protein
VTGHSSILYGVVAITRQLRRFTCMAAVLLFGGSFVSQNCIRELLLSSSAALRCPHGPPNKTGAAVVGPNETALTSDT